MRKSLFSTFGVILLLALGSSLANAKAVSYTHLTLPTIYSV